MSVDVVKWFLSTAEAAKLSGLTQPKIQSLIRSQILPAKNVNPKGKKPRWMIPKINFDAFLTPDSVDVSQAKNKSRRRRLDDGLPQEI
jgi:glutaredoxin 2